MSADQTEPAYSRSQIILSAAGVFIVALAVYSWTLAPTVTLVDSGELIVVAHSLGVAHPPGTPLWVMLAHLASLVPWGNVALRTNFSSAFFAASAAAMLTLAIAELMLTIGSGSQTKRKKGRIDSRSPAGRTKDYGTSVLFPAIAAGLLLAFSRTLWSYATITEVYTLNTFLIVTILFLMLRWRRRILADRSGVSVGAKHEIGGRVLTGHDLPLYVAAFIFGLALGVHHVTVALILPALAILVFKTEGLSFFRSRRLWIAALISFLALLAVYSYLPIAASRGPIINWGKPLSLREIWWHISGRQYQVFLVFAPNLLGVQLIQSGRLVLREFGSPWLPVTLLFAVVGGVGLFKRDRGAFWWIALLIMADLAYALVYDIAEDKEAYYLPAFIAIAIAASAGLRQLITSEVFGRWPAWKTSLAVGAACLLVSGTALATNWPFNNRRHYFIAQDYVENLFRTVGSNGLLLTFDWQVESPMLFAQTIDRRRPDAKVVDLNLLRRPWYFDYLRQSYPELIERSREQIDPFLVELNGWEQNPQLYEIDRARNRRINTLYLELIRAIVINEGEVGPVYVTSDVLSADRRGDEAIEWIRQNYQPVPEGLVFRLTTDREFHDSPDVELQTRGLADGTLRFEPDDVVRIKVLPAYVTMLMNRGLYLATFDQHERAIAEFKKALVLDPNNLQVQHELELSMSKLRTR